jgi:hypothetical protein
VKIVDGSPASSSRGAGSGTRDEKPGRAASEGSVRNNNNNSNGAKAATVASLSYPAPHPHHAIHYFPPYPPPYDHARVVVGSAAPQSNGEQGVARPLPTAGPYTSAQYERLKLPQSGMIPSHYPGTATYPLCRKASSSTNRRGHHAQWEEDLSPLCCCCGQEEEQQHLTVK